MKSSLTIVIVLLALLGSGLCACSQPDDEDLDRSTESQQIPLLPEDVAVFGVSSPAAAPNAKHIWFQTNTDGEFKKELREGSYNPRLTRWVGCDVALMRDDTIEVHNPCSGEVKNIKVDSTATGMLDGFVSPNKKFIALFSYVRGGNAVFLSDGENTVSSPHPIYSTDVLVTDAGDMYSLEKDWEAPEGKPPGFCTYNMSISSPSLQQQCLLLGEGRTFSFGAFSLLDGIPHLFVVWYDDEGAGWSLYRREHSDWAKVNDKHAFPLNPEVHGHAGQPFVRSGKLYMLTDTPGFVRIPFPTQETTELGFEFTSLESLITGQRVSVTRDGTLINYVFFRDENLGAGQYLSSFNIDDPTASVGPWRIPPELLTGTGYNSFQAIDSIFINDESTRAELGAEPLTP